MADVIINGETQTGVEAVNLLKTDGTTETYYPDAVRYVEQTLTEEQKAQARANIGVADKEEIVNDVLAELPETGGGSNDAYNPVEYTPEECMAAFFEYQAKKLKNYDILDTSYADASGYAQGSYTTPADLFRIGLIVASNSHSIKWWGGREKYATVNFMGEHEREETFPDLWNGVGGTRYCNKSGGVTYGSEKHRAGFQITTIYNQHAAISIMVKGADYYPNITTYVSNIKQMLKDLHDGKTVTEPEGLAAMVAAGGGYVASFLPGDIAMYQQLTYDQMISSDGTSGVLKDFMIRNNPKAKLVPASTTKIATMMCVLDTMGSETEIVKVLEADITDGSGLEVFAGDKLTVGDALFLMMRNSNNTIATMLARYVGWWVLSGRCNTAIGGSDNNGNGDILVVTVDVNNVASHSPAEIASAANAGKVVFFSDEGVIYDLQAAYAEDDLGEATFIRQYSNPPMLGMGQVNFTIDSEKNVTINTVYYSAEDSVGNVIKTMKENGELGGGESCVYTLAEGETIEDAPESAQIVVDPFTEPSEVEMVATFADGTTATYKLCGEVVSA